jgi:AraC-like DNA-binding protein
LSIREIALKLNFASQSFFGKYFKQRVGVSPSRYKIWDGRTEEILANTDFASTLEGYSNVVVDDE